MDGLGSEVGNKMRSAVKAKLVELGSGTAGYIDDELPDYVMIMVANKRSKEQMIGDLSLFLGKNTDVFVNWLHQVLEKLQEVTLPSTTALKTKHKPNALIPDKRDKKTKPKKRVLKDKSPENSTHGSTTPPIQNSSTSINDIFANQLIERAKQAIEPPVSVKKNERNGASTDGFDIPTISEIAKKAVGAVVCRKEITELAELQKKIDQAKRQLRHMNDESEDEDFINLGADKLDFDAELSNNSKEPASIDKFKNSSLSEQPTERASATVHQKITFDERNNDKDSQSRKTSILNRLGTRGEPTDKEKTEKSKNIISLSAHRRVEQAIYVPAHRRASEATFIAKNRPEQDKIRERSPQGGLDTRRSQRGDHRPARDSQSRRPRETAEPRDLREKMRQRERDIEVRANRTNRDVPRDSIKNDDKQAPSNRIGSRVIVAPVKPDYDEDEIEVPINSVVKVKPRPLIPRNKQASKNLLLRAVAEAQKSTALVNQPPREFKAKDKNKAELYTKTFRNKLQKSNIVVQIAGEEMETIEVDESTDMIELEKVEEEYIPKSTVMDKEAFVYIPKAIHNNRTNDSQSPKTQFVVTLDSLDFPSQKQSQGSKGREHIKAESSTGDRKKIPISSRIGKRAVETENEHELRKAAEVSYKKSPASLKRKRTPICFDTKNPDSDANCSEPLKKRRSSVERKSSEREYRKVAKEDPLKRDNHVHEHDSERGQDANEGNSKIRTLKTNNQNKYDNLPPLSSAIMVTTNESKSKKDHCKFYPSCTRGDRCEYYHPTTPCKAFPNCKYGDACLYIHPKCKFDLTCSRLDCNFTHTQVATAAPPLASHVVPVSNYKKIVTSSLPTLCRFYPNCSNTLCEFYHPKPCKFGKSCANKIECNFYHFDLPTPANAGVPSKNKMKWVASAV